jgi:hypothetical protein
LAWLGCFCQSLVWLFLSNLVLLLQWHLGNFWVKDGDDRTTPADKRWPASHPGMHGFDEWHATEASAESSTTNCGCVEDWKTEGDGCIIGGGYWTHNQSLDCTNYWSYANTTATGYAPADSPSDRSQGALPADCTDATAVPRSCVSNLTSKIEGDDSTFILGRFEEYLAKRQANNDERPVMAWLHLHTNHVPHFALPQWYHAYNDSLGNWAGDYLGTISQMDAALGTYLPLLEKYGIANDTLTFFSADNGAHTAGRSGGQNSASLGLRQCKASLFQGGILEPSFAHWPAGVKEHTVVRHATSTLDILATFEELAGVTGSNPNPTWAQDGVSIASLLRGEVGPNTSRPVLLPFTQGGQWAIINQTDGGKTWKIVQFPQKGQCDDFLPPYGDQKDPCKDGCLFEIESDPTETNDICLTEPAMCATMRSALDAFKASVHNSQVNETQCAVPPSDPGPGPNPPAQGSFFKEAASGKCLTVATKDVHGLPLLGACDGGSKWTLGAKNRLQNADATGNCLKLDQDHYPGCNLNVPIWTGVCEDVDAPGLGFDAANGRIESIACANMCVGQGNQATGDLVTVDCSDAAAVTLQQES